MEFFCADTQHKLKQYLLCEAGHKLPFVSMIDCSERGSDSKHVVNCAVSEQQLQQYGSGSDTCPICGGCGGGKLSH